jgi:DNA polymerase-3 subunit epsilon
VVVAYRAEFDATILRRELAHVLGTRMPNRFVDLAVLLPALFPGTQNDTLEEWLGHFGLGSAVRNRALIDAYAHAALLLIVLERASRLGLHTTGELIRIEKAQRWLGLRR